MKKLLFVCSRNQWRSPTAQQIWRRSPDYDVRSAGTSAAAQKTVSSADIRWAEVIFVMETKHKNRLQARFSAMLQYKPVLVLDIVDEYRYMDAELIDELQAKVEACLATLDNGLG